MRVLRGVQPCHLSAACSNRTDNIWLAWRKAALSSAMLSCDLRLLSCCFGFLASLLKAFAHIQPGPTLHVCMQPHCDFVSDSVEQSVTAGEVDVVITPVVTQQLGTQSVGYPLVLSPLALFQMLSFLI